MIKAPLSNPMHTMQSYNSMKKLLLYWLKNDVDFLEIHSLSAGHRKAEATRLDTTVTGKLTRRLSPPQKFEVIQVTAR